MKKILFPVLLCSLFACKKDKDKPVEPSPSASLRVEVYDGTLWEPIAPKGVPTPYATVQLFASRQDYLDKKPSFTTKTVPSGVAEFKSVPPGTYFIVVVEGEKTNTWDDGSGHTMVADSLFQSEKEIKAPETVALPGAAPGDFRFKDLNMDMMISAADVTEAPFDSVVLKIDDVTDHSVIIGYKSNYEGSLFKTSEEVERELNSAILMVDYSTKYLKILDGVLSDDAECPNLPNSYTNWCEYDQFTFTANYGEIGPIWTLYYNNIKLLNKILISLDKMPVKYPELTAQAKALRAYIYLNLQTYFGGVPVFATRFMSPDIRRTSQQDTRAYIKKELTEAIPALSAVNPSDKQWRITSHAAHMLLARLAFQESDIEALIEHTDAVINSKSFILVDSIAVFDSPTNSEVIWNVATTLSDPFKNYFDRGGIKVNFSPLIRYTETWLLRGYGKAMMNDINGTTDIINFIRTRGKKVAIYPKNMDEAITELGILYKQELYREGFRYSFLVLTNQAKQVLEAKGYKNYHNLLPIPTVELDTYPNMTQNPGYN